MPNSQCRICGGLPLKVFVDLCSGVGGASQAFDKAPDWITIKIDIEEYLLPENQGLFLCDVTDVEATLCLISNRLAELSFNHDDTLVVWASPPCTEFSCVNQFRNTVDPDLTILMACMEIIDRLDCNYWVIENVKGAHHIFNEELERTPRQILGPFFLWGEFPLISIEHRDTFKHRKMLTKGSRLLRPHLRAKVPMAVSEGLRSAIDCQTKLVFGV